jgi:hypothetical protein
MAAPKGMRQRRTHGHVGVLAIAGFGGGWRADIHDPMSTVSDDEDMRYRAVIDRLVDDCHRGQGQLGAARARAGVWNANATPENLPDQHEINVLLTRMSREDREVLGRMLQHAFAGGVHASLAALHERSLPPFDRAYEGTPFHDFVGRMAGWTWTSHERS